MQVLLTTLNAKYIHKNLALRWLYVSSYCKEDVEIIEYTIKEDISKIVEELLTHEAQVIAFSVYIWNIEPTLEIIRQIKHRSTKHIIVGGPEVTYESFEILHQGVDAISIGEGESSFWKYIKNFEMGVEEEVAGIYTEKFPNKQVMKSDLTYNEKLENPYFLTFDEYAMDKRYFYFETSRGCPYKCEYCLSSTDSQVRLFSETYIFSMLEKISQSNIRIVKLLDRTFNVHPTRALKIARYMNEYCPNQIFQFEIVAETLSEELLTFFCEEADKERFRFEIGVQSFHGETLQAVGRIQNNERLIEVISRLQKAKVVMHVDLIAGLPYEGMELFQHSFNSLYALHTAEIQLGILKLLKGTRLKQKQEEYAYVYNEKPPYDILETKWLDKNALEMINNCAHAVEKYYNSGRLRYSVDTILSLGLYPDAFSLFIALGRKLKQLSHPYQPHQTFQLLKEVLNQEENVLIEAILKYDYFRIFKQRPKIFLENSISKELRKSIQENFLEKGLINEQDIHNYTYIDSVYYKGEVGYQMILYNNKQTYPRRWFIGKDILEEIL